MIQYSIQMFFLWNLSVLQAYVNTKKNPKNLMRYE